MRIDYLSPTIYVTDILIVLLICIFFFRRKNSFKKIRFSALFMGAFVFLIFVMTIGIIASKNQAAGFYGLLKLLEFTLLGICVSRIAKELNFKTVLKMLSAGIIFESVLAILQFINKGSLNGVFYYFGERAFNSQTPGIANAVLNGELVLRPYGTLPHPNVLAGYLLISMTLLLFNLGFMKKISEKIFSIASISVGTISLFLSMGRVPIVIWLGIFGFWLVINFNKIFSRKNFRNYFTAGVIFIAIVLLFFIVRFRFIGFSLSDESVVLRESLAGSATRMIVKNPVLGVGLNNFLPNLPYFEKQMNPFFYLQPVHNIYLLIASEVGIVGLVYFVWFIYETYVGMLKSDLIIKRSLFISLSSVLLIGFFDHYFLTLQQGQILFSIILGLCWATNA